MTDTPASPPAPPAPATLADLRPGDEVAVTNFPVTPRLAVIERITPSGRIVVEGRQYGPDGYALGARSRSFGYGRARIEVPADGHRAKVLWATARSRWSSLERSGKVPSLASLARLVSALEAIEAEATRGD